MKPDDPLDQLFAAARQENPDTDRIQFAFETRVLARVREEAGGSWFSWAWKLCPYFAALAIAVGTWGYMQGDTLPAGESVVASLRQGGLSVLEFYFSADE